MCGIFGLSVQSGADFTPSFVKKSLTQLAMLSESRGKDSSGLVFRNDTDQQLTVLKGALSLNHLLKHADVKREFNRAIDTFCVDGAGERTHPFVGMGHSRLVTNGSQMLDVNNQPVVKNGVIGIHNGIIVNDKELWASHPDLERLYDIDTEVMLALVGKNLRRGDDFGTAVSNALSMVRGTVSAAFLLEDVKALALTTNNGSLYVLRHEHGLLAFASEEYFLRVLSRSMELKGAQIRQLQPGEVAVWDLETFQVLEGGISAIGQGPPSTKPYRIIIESFSDGRPQQELVLDPATIAVNPKASSEAALLENNIDRIRNLRRCTGCILPETFPFIFFDAEGVCNYCRNYVPRSEPKPLEQLFDLVKPYRSKDGGYDCLVPYSGGRDSTHTLHFVKNVLKLNPVTLTYDWGMVNDLARRNIARVCGKLGVENIIVSADIAWKRKNIRKNILAWLARPHLGMVPLFMAGDKFFFYYTDQIKRQTGIRLNIWGINPLENTDFKVGFMNVPPDHEKERIYSLSAKRQVTLMLSLGKALAENPRYLNGSMWDTMGSFVSRSIVPHRDYYHLYDYVRWDEHEIETLVLEEYEWEMAIDTDATWRIGDGTAPFYNYIYYTVAGFSEYDSFRSNQIREGMMTRDQALARVAVENNPRYPSIKWYLDIVGIDFVAAIRRINDIPKLYQ